MDSPAPAPRSLLRRALPWIGGAALLALVVLGLVLPGPEPRGGFRLCREYAIGPVGAALTGVTGPWPASWQELLDAPSSKPLGVEGTAALRCPEDPDPADPLASPSFVLVTGLDRDMPPQLVACHERACFHVRSYQGNTSYAQLWFVTLGGAVDAFALQVAPNGGDARARELVEQSMASLVARDRRGLALAGRRAAAADGDAGALRLIRESLQDSDHRLRLCAAWTAGASGQAALVAPLQAALAREREIEVREELARSLAKLGDRSGVAVLLAAFEAPPEVRGRMPGEPADDPVRRARAHDGLVALAGTDHGGLFDPQAAAAWKAWARP